MNGLVFVTPLALAASFYMDNAWAEAEAVASPTAVTIAAPASAATVQNQASEPTVTVSGTLVNEDQFKAAEDAGRNSGRRKKSSKVKDTTLRTLIKQNGEISYVGSKSIALNYQTESRTEVRDSIFPFEAKLTVFGYKSIYDIQPKDMVQIEYEKVIKDPEALNPIVTSTLKSVRLIKRGEETAS